MAHTGTCRLCGASEQLCHSHIVPEFLYVEIYDSDHKMVAVSATPGDKEKAIQKGLREYLLCSACELKLSKLEGYAAKTLRALPDLSKAAAGHIEFIQGVDYERFKLFVVSLIWRMGVSTLPTFEDVDLGPHEAKLRAMLAGDNPGLPLEYGCLLARPNGSSTIGEMLKPPVSSHLDGHRIYVALFFGLVWVFYVSKHSVSIAQAKSFIGPSNELPIHIASVTGEDLILSIGSEMKKAGLLQ